MEISKKSILLIVVIGILILLNVATLTTLWVSRCKEPGPPQMIDKLPSPKGRLMFEKELNFSKQQLEAVDKLREEHFANVQNIMDDIRKNKDELFNLLKNPDSLKVLDLTGKIGTEQKEIELASFYHFQKIRNLCDDKQKVKFDEIFKEIINPGPPHPEEIGHQGMQHPDMQHPDMQQPGMQHPDMQPGSQQKMPQDTSKRLPPR